MKALIILTISFVTCGTVFADCPEALSFDQTVNCIIDEASSENFDTILSNESGDFELNINQNQKTENLLNSKTDLNTTGEVQFVNIE